MARRRKAGGNERAAGRRASCRGRGRGESIASARVVGARRQEPAGAGEIRRNEELVASEQRSGRRCERRAPSGFGGHAAETSFEGAVIGFKGGQAGVEQVALRDDDHVEPRRDLVTTENLSNQSFRSISLNGSPELPRGGDPQPADVAAVRQDEQGAVAAMDPDALFVDLLELRRDGECVRAAEIQPAFDPAVSGWRSASG